MRYQRTEAASFMKQLLLSYNRRRRSLALCIGSGKELDGRMRRKQTERLTVQRKIWILAGLLVILAILFVTARLGRSSDHTYTKDRVGIEEVASGLSFGVYEEEDWDAFFAESKKDYLTGESLQRLLVHLDVGEYVDVPEMSKRHAVTREEWFAVYEQILDLLDMEQSVEKKTVLLLDFIDAKEQTILVTDEGDYATALPKDWFSPWEAYELYCCKNRCIGITGTAEGERTLCNVYLTGCADGEISFLYGGASYQKKTGAMEELAEPVVCDLVLEQGELVSVQVKPDTISGELLSYDAASIEIEGYGKVGHTGKLPVYQTYGEVSEKSITDVVLGNMTVEYVTGGDEVCAILIRRPASIEDIRVLLLAEDGTNFRPSVSLVCDGPCVLSCGDQVVSVPAGAVIHAADYLTADPNRTLIATPESEEAGTCICDENGTAVSNRYAGSLEIRLLPEGYTVVNEVPLETYLCAVVPSEMPSSYAPEAQKAQAVCARSYAYIQLLRADLAAYGAHINDSTSYQVYNRIAPTPESQTAVWETAGQILTYNGAPAEAYYFSTSMGYTDTAAIWNVEDPAAYGYLKSVCLNMTPAEGDLSSEETFVDYIAKPAEGYDSGIKFYRWFAPADYREKTGEIGQILLKRHGVSPRNITFYAADGSEITAVDESVVSGLGTLTGITVTERSGSGCILTLSLQYENGSAAVRSEYNIRSVLGCGAEKIVYADGSEAQMALLPSAFCALRVQPDGTVTLVGGGYGHGLGMSQNGANGMAKAGMNYEEILHYFYNEIQIEHMQEDV